MKKLIVILTMLICSVSVADEPSLIDAISYLIDRNPHPKRGDLEWATEMANALEKAATEFGLDPYLLVAMADIESDFSPDVVSLKKLGPGGEKGILQCGKDCMRNCPYFIDDAAGQAMCGRVGCDWRLMIAPDAGAVTVMSGPRWHIMRAGSIVIPPPTTMPSGKPIKESA